MIMIDFLSIMPLDYWILAFSLGIGGSMFLIYVKLIVDKHLNHEERMLDAEKGLFILNEKIEKVDISATEKINVLSLLCSRLIDKLIESKERIEKTESIQIAEPILVGVENENRTTEG